eukprot:6199224-Pleurochrysis_carterae.AAC.1
MGEVAPLMHPSVTGGDYDEDSMPAIAATFSLSSRTLAHEALRTKPCGQRLQQIVYPRVTAKLREALDKQIAKHEKHQSIVSYPMDFLNAVGVHNDTSTPSWLWNRAFWRSIARQSSPWIGHQAAL